MFDWLKSLGQKGSEKEVQEYLLLFMSIEPENKANILGMVALMHCQLRRKMPELERWLASPKGQYAGEFASLIVQMNGLSRDFHKQGKVVEAAAAKFWTINFRCMAHDSLHAQGERLWRTAAESFPSARVWLQSELSRREASESTLSGDLRQALQLHSYVPPRFSSDAYPLAQADPLRHAA